jgi:hypothetical protein
MGAVSHALHGFPVYLRSQAHNLRAAWSCIHGGDVFGTPGKPRACHVSRLNWYFPPYGSAPPIV